MRHYLFLTFRMALGYGVDVAISNIIGHLTALGHQVTIGCLESDGHYPDLDIRQIDASPDSITGLINELGCDCIIAHTTPFFEVLPLLDPMIPRWALEYGDPTPEFFPLDGDERKRIKDAKIKNCYPVLDGVMAISHFIRSDICWPAASVIHIGCDHVPDPGSKGPLDFHLDPAAAVQLHVGTLMRLGHGEANYKGNQLFLEMVEKIIEHGVSVRFEAMGRGTPEDAAFFEAKGIKTYLNAPDSQKWEYLRGLDVFISPSMWEGFNLPLAEAQALGTMGIAFGTGAHPEVTPFVFSSVEEIVALLKRLAADRALLQRSSLLSYRFVRKQFFWEKCTLELLRLTSGYNMPRQPEQQLFVAQNNTFEQSFSRRVEQFFSVLRTDGVICAISRVARFLTKKAGL